MYHFEGALIADVVSIARTGSRVWRRVSLLWSQAGDDDGSVFMRQMTDAELTAQASLVAAL